MPHLGYGPKAKKQTKCLLEALLAYANDEFEDCDRLQIRVNWQTEKQLVVRAKVRFLEELTAEGQDDVKLNKEQIKAALKRLEKFLEILEDNRSMTQGAEDWHFTLKLWHRRHDKEANLKQFDMEWENRRPEKSKQVTGEESKATGPDTQPDQGIRRSQRFIPPDLSDEQVDLAAVLYVERPPIEARALETINQAGALIRIKAPRQMGKTSLLNRILNHAAGQGYCTVRLTWISHKA